MKKHTCIEKRLNVFEVNKFRTLLSVHQKDYFESLCEDAERTKDVQEMRAKLSCLMKILKECTDSQT